MSKRSIGLPAYLAGLLLIAGLLAFSGPDGATSVTVGPVLGADSDTLPDLVGTWVGSWQDTVYWVSGAMTWVINQDGSDMSATGTIDL